MRGLPVVALAAAWLLTAPALAHAPLARGVLLGPGGELRALWAPGFGLLVPAAGGFAYACDGLAGVAGREPGPGPVLGAGGALLVGGPGGVARLDAGGCPGGDLPGAPGSVVALGAAGSDAILAVTGGDAPALYRSADGARSWQLQQALPAGPPVDAVVATADAGQRVYMTRAAGAAGELLVAAGEGGDALQIHPLPRPVQLLYAGPPAWALGADPDTRAAVLLRAPAAEGPFEEVHRVRFMGGFARDRDSGRVWIADEAGGIFRSDDGGDGFAMVHGLAASCLGLAADGALWACTPGTANQPAVMVSRDGGEGFEAVMSFAQVQRMVECGPGVPVAELCAFAWAEWQADVLGGAAVQSDAGVAQGDAGAAEPPVRNARGGGCATLGVPATADGGAPLAVLVVLALLPTWALVRRSRSRSRCAPAGRRRRSPAGRGRRPDWRS